MDSHDEIDELARAVELAIREFDEALARHEKRSRAAPQYSDSTSLWGEVKDELYG